MSAQDSVWMTRAKICAEARLQRQGPSVTRYLWPSGRSYRLIGRHLTDIPEAYANCCADIYASRIAATSRESIRGSAFFVEAFQGPTRKAKVYAVTSAGVLQDEQMGSTPVIRIEREDGGSQLISTKRESWRVDDSSDLAVFSMSTRPLDYSYVPIPANGFFKFNPLEAKPLRADDRVFLPERATRHQKSGACEAALVFGKISKTPGLKRENGQAEGGSDEAISMKSCAGSDRRGSPVFLCEPPYDVHFGGVHDRAWEVGPQLLGVYTGQNMHFDPQADRSARQAKGEMQTCHACERESEIVPVWKLSRMLDLYESEQGSEREENVLSSPTQGIADGLRNEPRQRNQHIKNESRFGMTSAG